MSRILIYRWINIFENTDYRNLHKSVNMWFNHSCPNFGNKLWYQGLVSEISTEENIIEYYDPSMKIENINEQYDMMIYPMANIFSLEFSVGLPKISNFIHQLKIPVFVISCGAQAKSYDDINTLVESIGQVSKDFISSVYNTGGQFALRGYFTAEFFHKLGFHNPAVVGCPSLYQLGNKLRINKKDISINDFKPSFNGRFGYIKNYLNHFKNSLFYDQDEFYDVLYNLNYFNPNNPIRDNAIKLLRYNLGGLQLAEMILSDRIRLIADMWDWQDSFISEGISFSYGGRIHGNIIALLSGVPATVVGFDTRTREMAEFYNIPYVNTYDDVKPSNLYNYYQSVDFSDFNKNFSNKVDEFEKFLIKNNIVKKMNVNNSFLNHSDKNYPTNSDFIMNNKAYAKEILNNKVFYYLYYKIFKTYIKIFG